MKKSKRTLTPKLRFPEFRDGEGWREVAIRETAAVIAGQSPRGEYYNDTGNGTPFYQGKTDFGDVFINPPTKWTTQVTKLALEDDILMSVRAPVGALNVSTQEICIGRGLAALRAKEDKWFLYYLLLQVNHLFVGNGGSVFDSISKSQIESTQIPFPPSLPEQGKIADCLSSLDGLITAEGRTLEALKTHKKGLMRQLFPQPGQTQPRLRFPEFRDKGEWSEKKLSEITSAIFDGTHQTPTYTEAGIPFYSVENLISGNANKFISKEDYDLATTKNKPEKGDILLTRIGKIGFSQVVTWDREFSVYVTLAVIKRSSQFNSHYLHCLMQSDYYQSELRSKSLSNAVPPKINMDSLRETKVLIPIPAEQQKIAACLTSLDTRIAAQAAKVESLKQHKRGLMQQLFPAPEEQ
ncbi:MAG: restriction endonuclease subunit S [Candidatus Nitrospinota bacterium M3_3B_026]